MASDTELFGEELTSPIIEEECHNDAEESSLDEPNSAKNISVEMETGKLKKKLGFVALFAYIFGGIIGSGIFISPVKVIQTVSTGGLVLGLWLAGGTIAVLGGVSYVELGSFVRNSGGEFVYIEKGFSFRGRKPFNVIGSLLSFSTIWTNVLILRPASISIIMLTFAEYLVRPFYPFYCEVPSVVMSLLAVAAISECVCVCVCARVCVRTCTFSVLYVQKHPLNIHTYAVHLYLWSCTILYLEISVGGSIDTRR